MLFPNLCNVLMLGAITFLMRLVPTILSFLFFGFSSQAQQKTQYAFEMREMPNLDKQIAESKDSVLRVRLKEDSSDTSSYLQAIKLHFDRRGQLVRIDELIESPDSLVRLYVQDKRLVGVFLMNPEEMLWIPRSTLPSRYLKEHYPFCLAGIDAYGLILLESWEKIRCGWQD